MTLFQQGEDLSQHPQGKRSNCSSLFITPLLHAVVAPVFIPLCFISFYILIPLNRVVVGLRSGMPFRGGRIVRNPEPVIGWGGYR